MESKIKKLRADAEKLMDLFLAEGGAPDAVRARLAKVEAAKVALQRQSETLRRQPRPADLLPHPTVILAYAEELAATLKAGKERARAARERHVGKIPLTVKSEGPKPGYWASGLLDFGPVDGSLRYQEVAGTRKPTYLRFSSPFAAGERSAGPLDAYPDFQAMCRPPRTSSA